MNPVYLLIFIIGFFVGTVGSAYAEGPEVDPALLPNGMAVIPCNYPTTRVGGDSLAVSEIAVINFFVSADKSNWNLAGSSPTCSLDYDLKIQPDGQYYFTYQAIDTGGRESAIAFDKDDTQYRAFVVKRLAPPNYPTGAAITFN